MINKNWLIIRTVLLALVMLACSSTTSTQADEVNTEASGGAISEAGAAGTGSSVGGSTGVGGTETSNGGSSVGGSSNESGGTVSVGGAASGGNATGGSANASGGSANASGGSANASGGSANASGGSANASTGGNTCIAKTCTDIIPAWDASKSTLSKPTACGITTDGCGGVLSCGACVTDGTANTDCGQAPPADATADWSGGGLVPTANVCGTRCFKKVNGCGTVEQEAWVCPSTIPPLGIINCTLISTYKTAQYWCCG